MIGALLVVLACLAAVFAQLPPPPPPTQPPSQAAPGPGPPPPPPPPYAPGSVYTGMNNWLATAQSDSDCAFYAFDEQRKQSGFGYMFFNPFVCTGVTVPNLVGCTGNLNFTTYLNYYMAANNVTAGSPTFSYFQALTKSFQTYGAPSNFNAHYQVKNCMFCKLLDSYATNFDPFCPAEVCERYKLPAEKCLSKNPVPDNVGIGIKTLAPVLDSVWDVDTEYDILFSVYGVSNTEPYVGMPLSQAAEGCPRGLNTRGLDGMPTGFTFQPDYQWLKDNLAKISILRQDGSVVHPECSSIAPNGGPTERVVVFCGRDLGSETNLPTAIWIDGPVKMSNGQFTTTTKMSVKVGTLNQGSLMISAERYGPEDAAIWPTFFAANARYHKDPCPAGTKQIIMTSWTKGVRQTHPSLITYPAYVKWTGQKNGVRVGLADGRIVAAADGSFSLHDDDDDGFIHVCMTTDVRPVNVSFSKGLFFDPRNTMTINQLAQVTAPISMYDPYPIVNPAAVATPTLPVV